MIEKLQPGDYYDFFSIEKMLSWTEITVNRISSIEDGVYNTEYFCVASSNKIERRTSAVSLSDFEQMVRSCFDIPRFSRREYIKLTENDPKHKILIDRFKIFEMQSIIEM